jgi:DNA-binding MarR family transcriptional regulator
MPFDALVANPGRLRILTALAGAPKQPFVDLRRSTGLTDGNLSTHARKLESAGFIAIEKTIASGKPLTTLHLTTRGREALVEHAHSLLRSLQQADASSSTTATATLDPQDDGADDSDWVD